MFWFSVVAVLTLRSPCGTRHLLHGVEGAFLAIVCVLHGEGRLSPATPTKQNNDQPSRGYPQEVVKTFSAWYTEKAPNVWHRRRTPCLKFVNRLGDIAAESGRIPKGAFVRWAVQLLSVTVQRGIAEMYRRSGLVISREQGLRYDAGFAEPVLMS